MVRAVHVAPATMPRGSLYKYPLMFSRLVHLDFAERVEGDYDFAIIRGDGDNSYKRIGSLPYILIENDVYTLRHGKGHATEQHVIENAAAVLFTSDDHAAYIRRCYRCPPSRVVHLRPLASDLDFEPLPKLPRTIVYAGGLTDHDGPFGYRWYSPIFAALTRAGWTVHIYPTHPDHTDGYERFVLHEQVPQSELYREMSQYTLGFQGYALAGPQGYVRSCRPNKLWEYLGAGIPTLGFNPGNGGSIYHGRWGLIAPSLEALAATADAAAAMSIPDAMRRSNVIDSDQESFRELVEVVNGNL